MGKLQDIFEEISTEKNIPKEAVYECLKKAFIAGYRQYLYKNEGMDKESRKKDKTQEVNSDIVFTVKNKLILQIEKTVVKKPSLLLKEISLRDAKKIKNDVEINDVIKVQISYDDFPLTIVATVKNSFTSEINNYINNKIYDEFKQKEGTIIQGKVHKSYKKDLYIFIEEFGIEALLPAEEQSPIENIRLNDIKKFLVKSVKKDTEKEMQEKAALGKRMKNEPRIILSRSDPKFIERLIEMEVEELAKNEVEIKGIAREVGYKTKVAVVSNNPMKDAVGTFLGPKSFRIQNVRREIGDEVIEVIPYNNDIEEYIKSALNVPKFGNGRVFKIKEDANDKKCIFVVENDLTKDKVVGKNGINVKLAYKLTDWKIDVKTHEEFEKSEVSKLIVDKVEDLFSGSKKSATREIVEEVEEQASIDELIDHLGRDLVIKLKAAGIDTIERLIDYEKSDRLKNVQSMTTEELLMLNKFILENIEIQEEEDEELDEEVIVCPNCSEEISESDKSCPHCGIPLE